MIKSLTPEALQMVRTVAETGSFAAAARVMGRVPSALTYSIRQLEDSLDVLLFDRSSRAAKLTPAGEELVREGAVLLNSLEQVAQRVRRVATGWESELIIAVDSVVRMSVVFDLVKDFQALGQSTRISLRNEAMHGTWEALQLGRADLSIGVIEEALAIAGTGYEPLGIVQFVFCVAPSHPLAGHDGPISDETLLSHTAVAALDTSSVTPAMTVGLLPGQPVLRVPSLEAKREAQLRGLGVGYLPAHFIAKDLAEGRLLAKERVRPARTTRVGYAWRHTARSGEAMRWWLRRLESSATRKAFLSA